MLQNISMATANTHDGITGINPKSGRNILRHFVFDHEENWVQSMYKSVFGLHDVCAVVV